MSRGKLAVFLISIITIVLGVVLIISFEQGSTVLVSPVLKSGKSFGLNQWFPKATLGVQVSIPQITAKAIFFVDTKTSQMLYAQNAHEKLPIASLVKVATAIVALEYRNLDEKYLVSQKAADMEPDKMLLIPGEKLTLKELLYGIFLISANDAAEVLAEGTTGNRSEFIALMNKKAQQLGMKNTYFVNPTGLDEDGENSYSTAYDLVLLSRYAIKYYPVLVEISATPHVYIDKTSEHQDYDIYSGINLITTYPGVVGFKTGYTPEAGLTLITLARKDGHEVIGILLGSESRRDEARELLDYSFKKLGS